MPNKSSLTVPIATRISIQAYAILKRRSGKRGLRVGEYIRRLIQYDALRKR